MIKPMNKVYGRMKELSITQAELAQKMGISTNALNYKLRGTRPMTLDEGKKMCVFLNIKEMEVYDFLLKDIEVW